MKKITIILPAYNEEASIELIAEQTSRIIENNPGYDWEFLLVNDGSTDNTLQQMVRLRRSDPQHYSYIDLSRNYGKEIAMMAGFDFASGNAVIIMDADMQHPIEVIPEMLQYWEEGYDDVYAVRRGNISQGWLRRTATKWYYHILQLLSRVPIQKNAGDFRLLDRSCVEALKQMREVERNTKEMYSWIGFRKKAIYYDLRERQNGKSKWSFLALINLALNGIMSYSKAPLRMASIVGALVLIAAFVSLFYFLVCTPTSREFPTLLVTVLFLGGVQLLSIGIMGEYLGRVFNEVKGRPGYLINSFNGELKDDGRDVTNDKEKQ